MADKRRTPIADTGSDTVARNPRRRGKTNADFAGMFYNGKTKKSAAAADHLNVGKSQSCMVSESAADQQPEAAQPEPQQESQPKQEAVDKGGNCWLHDTPAAQVRFS